MAGATKSKWLGSVIAPGHFPFCQFAMAAARTWSKGAFYGNMIRALLQALVLNTIRVVICFVAGLFGAYGKYDARSLTAKRVTQLLAAGGAFASPTTVVVSTSWTDVELGSVGTVRRLHLKYNQTDATAPASVIVKSLGVCFKVRCVLAALSALSRPAPARAKDASSRSCARGIGCGDRITS